MSGFISRGVVFDCAIVDTLLPVSCDQCSFRLTVILTRWLSSSTPIRAPDLPVPLSSHRGYPHRIDILASLLGVSSLSPFHVSIAALDPVRVALCSMRRAYSMSFTDAVLCTTWVHPSTGAIPLCHEAAEPVGYPCVQVERMGLVRVALEVRCGGG